MACEALRLPGAGAARPGAGRPRREPFPAFKDDVKLAQTGGPHLHRHPVRGDRPAPSRRSSGCRAGAALVHNVFPDSPAQKAGLLPGDVIARPARPPFTLYNEVRVWTYFASAGTPQTAGGVARRGSAAGHDRPAAPPRPAALLARADPGRPARARALAGALPGHGPGQARRRRAAPAVVLGHLVRPLQGLVARGDGLLPRPGRAGGGHHRRVARSRCATSSAGWKKPFPENVALDELRRTFIRYGVNGVPTFVMVDGQGKVESHVTGYGPDQGIGVPGWRFKP